MSYVVPLILAILAVACLWYAMRLLHKSGKYDDNIIVSKSNTLVEEIEQWLKDQRN